MMRLAFAPMILLVLATAASALPNRRPTAEECQKLNAAAASYSYEILRLGAAAAGYTEEQLRWALARCSAATPRSK